MSTSQYLFSAWTWNPVVIGLCAMAVAVYVMLRKAVRAGYFFGAVILLFLALCSPLNSLADGFLFSAHMVQHMLLLLIVPVLLLLGLRPSGSGAKQGRLPFRLPPLLGWAGGVGAMWLWHERTLCDLATRTETGRIVQIVSLLALGTLFWWPLLGVRKEQRVPPLTGVVYLFSACVACSMLGILITFSPAGAVCPVYLRPPDQPGMLNLIRNDWGFTPARDQQIGGLLMWLPGCGIYLAGILAMLVRWYGSADHATTRTELAESPGSLPIAPANIKVEAR